MLRAHTKVRSFVRPPPIPVFHSVPTSWSGHSRGRRAALSALRDGERAAIRTLHTVVHSPHTARGSHDPARRGGHDTRFFSPVSTCCEVPHPALDIFPRHTHISRSGDRLSEHAREIPKNTKKPSTADCWSAHIFSLS